MTEEEAYKLIEKYDNGGDISKKLIKRLKEDSSMGVLKEFLENPLLVSLLYKTFEYKEEIPYKKIGFYEQVYEALFNDHDKTKGSAYVHEKKTKLDRFQFEQILRAFGFLSLKTDKVEYSSQLIQQLLKQSIERFGWLKISVDDFIYDVTHAVPFIQKDGNEYKWVHKSFMEYFASCFICYDNKESEEKCLKKMIVSDDSIKYYNILDFCYEMDTLGFRKYAILPYLKDYIQKYNRYFEHNYYNDFDKKSLNIAKHLLALNINLYIVNNIYVDKVYKVYKGETKEDNSEDMEPEKVLKEMFNKTRKCFEENKIRMIHLQHDQFLYAFEDVNLLIYKIISDKLPDLFEEIYTEMEETHLNQKNVKIKFTDDINNPINKDKNIFKVVVENMFDIICKYDYRLFNYNKCMKLIKEIELESSNTNNDIFDL